MPEGSNFLLSNHSRLQIIWHHLERALRMSYKILIHSQDTDSRVSKKICMWKKKNRRNTIFRSKTITFYEVLMTLFSYFYNYMNLANSVNFNNFCNFADFGNFIEFVKFLRFCKILSVSSISVILTLFCQFII